jgi:hypothetical protein
MIAVVVMFVFCWLPIQAFNLIVYNKWYSKIMNFKTFKNIYIPVFFGCHFIAMGEKKLQNFGLNYYCFLPSFSSFDGKSIDLLFYE